MIIFNIKYDYDMFFLTPVDFRMSINADPNASFSLSTWILKSPTIKTLSAASTNSDRKSANSLIKSVWCPGGLYTVGSTNVNRDLLLTLITLIMLYKAQLFQTNHT